VVDATLSYAQAGAAIDAAALGLIGLALLGAIVRRLETAIWSLAAQGLLLGVAAGAAALAENAWRAWAAFGVALAVKAVAIPLILTQVLQRVALRREVETVVPAKLALPLAVGLVLVAYYVLEPFTRGAVSGFTAPNALPAALALQLLGLFTMVTRKKALTQLIGLVTMENGLYLAAVAATRGLPFAVEFGVTLDILTGVALMGLVIHEINRLFGGINTDRLRSLRG
jgi:hydrogenase-4 component E